MLGHELFRLLTNLGEKLTKEEAKSLMKELCEPEVSTICIDRFYCKLTALTGLYAKCIAKENKTCPHPCFSRQNILARGAPDVTTLPRIINWTLSLLPQTVMASNGQLSISV